MDLIIPQEELYKEMYSSWKEGKKRLLTRKVVSESRVFPIPIQRCKKSWAFFLVHQWKDLLYFNLSFEFENNETTLLFPCVQGVGVLP